MGRSIGPNKVRVVVSRPCYHERIATRVDSTVVTSKWLSIIRLGKGVLWGAEIVLHYQWAKDHRQLWQRKSFLLPRDVVS